ncbi:MAG: tetratricopeptide repeat protein [Fuerstiella sp.]
MKSHRLWIAGLLTVLTFLVFSPVLRFGFVNFDDGAYVTENPRVLAGLSWQNVIWAFSFDSCEPTSNWHPLTWLSLMADVTIFGAQAGPMHAVNLVLHLINVVLLFLVLEKMTGATEASAFVAAVFGVHPLHVESVAWISERKDVLSTLFILLTIRCHLLHVQTGRFVWNAAALVLFLLSLMSKQMYVTLPFLLLLFDYWPLRRLSAAPNGDHVKSVRSVIVAFRSAKERPFAERKATSQSVIDRTFLKSATVWPLVREKIPLLLTAVLFSVVAFAGQRSGGAVGSLEDYSILQRVLNACVSYAAYLSQTVWPLNLAVFYPYPDQLPWGRAALSLVLLGGITLAVIRLRDRHPELPVGWFWYLGTLVPVIGLVQIGRQSMADRYMYFPMTGLLVAVTWLAVGITRDQPGRRRVLQICGISVVLLLAVAGRIQTTYWKDSLTLFTRAAAAAESSLAYTKLGYERAQQREFDAATTLLHRALRLDPDYTAAHSSLGNTYLAEGNAELALQHFHRVIELQPDHAEAHYNLGIIYARLGQVSTAVLHYEAALKASPKDASIHSNLGIAFLMLGRKPEALNHLERALELQPDLPEAHFTLGSVLAAEGREAEAIGHLKQGLQSRPDAAEAHERLGQLYLSQGETALGEHHLQQAAEYRKPVSEQSADPGQSRGSARP